MTKENALYQAKLIIDNLPKEDLAKIPQEYIDYIENNMKINNQITINPDIPLEEQEIDDKTYIVLEEMIKKIEEDEQKNNKNYEEYINYDKKALIQLLQKYKSENEKISETKKIIENYKKETENHKKEIENLKDINNELYSNIQKCPKLVRRLFFKKLDEKKLLK